MPNERPPERLETVVTAKLSRSQRQSLAEVAAFHGITESEILRRVITSLLALYQDMKEQMSQGASIDDIVGRSTRFTLTQLMSYHPEELRKLADQFREAAYQLADWMEKKGRQGEGT